MLLLTRNLFFATIAKISDKGVMPRHTPTTDLWPIGTGVLPNSIIRVSGWNINGFRSIANKGDLKSFLQKARPDFMCLNETKIDLKGFQALSPDLQNPFLNYYGYWNFCKIKAGYSGVAIFTKHKPITVIEDFPTMPEYSLEGRVLTLEYSRFFIICIYSPCSGLELERLAFRTQQFDKAFKAHVDSLTAIKPVIIFGDMNVAHKQIDIAKPSGKERTPGFTAEERSNFSAFLKESKFIDTFRHIHPYAKKYSWWSYQRRARIYNDGWRLDYILADHRLRVLRAGIHNDVKGSDHCPVTADIELGGLSDIK